MNTTGQRPTTRTYEDLADAAERGELRSKPGTRRTGTEAVEASRTALLEAAGATTIEQVAQLTLGRPRLDQTRSTAGPSRQINVRAPDELHTALTRLAEEHNTSLSNLVRQALAHYVHTH